MKFRYPLIIFIAMITIGSILENIIDIPDNIRATCEITAVFLLWWIIAVAIWKICQKIRQSSLRSVQAQMQHQHTSKMQDIEQEMDEIEASLNAVTNNEKITPIWELPRKEP